MACSAALAILEIHKGVLLRPLGQVIYFMAPYVISYEEIDKMINVAYEEIKKVAK